MKVAVLGTGLVGRALGKGFAGLGHEVIVGTRDPGSAQAKEAGAAIGKARAARFADAAREAEIAVLATLWTGTKSALELAGASNLAGKVLIDATNPLEVSTGAPKLALGFSTSGAEQVQRWAPQAKVVKAFNIVTAAHMLNPKLAEGTPDMFIAGDDAAAKKQVGEIVAAFGWPVIDIGGLEAARLLEPLAMLWITYALRNNHWVHAFKLLRK